MFKGMNMNVLKQAQQMAKKMDEIKARVAQQSVTATAGGGMIIVTANGKMEIESIIIKPEVVDPDDVEMLQDLILSAVNEALRQANDMMSEAMAKVAGGLNIPGL